MSENQKTPLADDPANSCLPKASRMVVELLHPVVGLRFNSAAGEKKTIVWRREIPRIVAQCRAGEAIDWGGAAVQPSGYRVLFDGVGRAPQ